MFRNFATIGGTVAEVEEVIGEGFHGKDERSRIRFGQGFTQKSAIFRK